MSRYRYTPPFLLMEVYGAGLGFVFGEINQQDLVKLPIPKGLGGLYAKALC